MWKKNHELITYNRYCTYIGGMIISYRIMLLKNVWYHESRKKMFGRRWKIFW